ncbi:uncharacterized protein LOC143531609 isoform X1 [Bidens hawaiensis]|uniref:uncharacterized protein LOC143531609 isoform X1 n=1 Tax=Bidens hawaiensis TaxID=980011 RepID=UPI00404BA0DC
MLQSYHQRSLYNFRCLDELRGPQANQNYNPLMSGLKHPFYGSAAEKILNIRNGHSSFGQDHASWKNMPTNNIEQSQLGLFKNLDHGLTMLNQIQRQTTRMDMNVTSKDQEQEKKVLKRKELVLDHDQSELLDLNLSLQIKIPKTDDHADSEKEKDGFNENDISLSLFSPNCDSYSSSFTRSKHANTMGSSSGSLDLTL